MMKKSASWMHLGGMRWARRPGAGIPNYQFSKKIPHHRPQTSRTITHALRAPARWRITKKNTYALRLGVFMGGPKKPLANFKDSKGGPTRP